MLKNIALPASLVRATADMLEASDVHFRAFTTQSTLQNGAIAHEAFKSFRDKMQERFEDVMRKSGVDLRDSETSKRVYMAGYDEVDRREHDRAVSLRMKREAAEQRERQREELAEIAAEMRYSV